MKRIDGTNEKNWRHQWKESTVPIKRTKTAPMKRIDGTDEKNQRQQWKKSTAAMKKIDSTNEKSGIQQCKELTAPTKRIETAPMKWIDGTNAKNWRHQWKESTVSTAVTATQDALISTAAWAAWACCLDHTAHMNCNAPLQWHYEQRRVQMVHLVNNSVTPHTQRMD